MDSKFREKCGIGNTDFRMLLQWSRSSPIVYVALIVLNLNPSNWGISKHAGIGVFPEDSKSTDTNGHVDMDGIQIPTPKPPTTWFHLIYGIIQ